MAKTPTRSKFIKGYRRSLAAAKSLGFPSVLKADEAGHQTQLKAAFDNKS